MLIDRESHGTVTRLAPLGSKVVVFRRCGQRRSSGRTSLALHFNSVFLYVLHVGSGKRRPVRVLLEALQAARTRSREKQRCKTIYSKTTQHRSKRRQTLDDQLHTVPSTQLSEEQRGNSKCKAICSSCGFTCRKYVVARRENCYARCPSIMTRLVILHVNSSMQDKRPDLCQIKLRAG